MTIAVQGAGVRHNRGDRSRWTPTAAQSERIPTHEPDRGRRLLPPMPRAAPLASSRLSRSLSRHNDRLHGEFSSVISLGSMACRSRAYADDGLSLASLGPVQVGDGIIEGRRCRCWSAFDRPAPANDLSRLGTIGLDDELDGQAVGGPCLRGAGDGDQNASGAIQGCRALPVSPAKTLKTRSAVPTSFRASFSRSMNSCAPKSSSA
jgi:hypothetical protein